MSCVLGLLTDQHCLSLFNIANRVLQEKSFKQCKILLNKGGMKIMLGIRVEPELKDLLQKLADEENRSLSPPASSTIFAIMIMLYYL